MRALACLLLLGMGLAAWMVALATPRLVRIEHAIRLESRPVVSATVDTCVLDAAPKTSPPA